MVADLVATSRYFTFCQKPATSVVTPHRAESIDTSGSFRELLEFREHHMAMREEHCGGHCGPY